MCDRMDYRCQACLLENGIWFYINFVLKDSVRAQSEVVIADGKYMSWSNEIPHVDMSGFRYSRLLPIRPIVRYCFYTLCVKVGGRPPRSG